MFNNEFQKKFSFFFAGFFSMLQYCYSVFVLTNSFSFCSLSLLSSKIFLSYYALVSIFFLVFCSLGIKSGIWFVFYVCLFIVELMKDSKMTMLWNLWNLRKKMLVHFVCNQIYHKKFCDCIQPTISALVLITFLFYALRWSSGDGFYLFEVIAKS
jgi:hypothetical protein